jgi:hypothetical protein
VSLVTEEVVSGGLVDVVIVEEPVVLVEPKLLLVGVVVVGAPAVDV